MSSRISFKYIFELEAGQRKEYDIELDKESLVLVDEETKDSDPDWINLDFHQCANCPLVKEESPACPVAKSLSHLVDSFQSDISYTRTKVTVVAKERVYTKQTTLQQGLHSIMGLIIATSGCPHTLFLRPMAKYHLPFSTAEETIFRATSTYLLGQYFRYQREKKFDVNLLELSVLYQNMGQVNQGLIERVRNITEGDADKNALIILNTFTQQIDSGISTKLEDLQEVFGKPLSTAIKKAS